MLRQGAAQDLARLLSSPRPPLTASFERFVAFRYLRGAYGREEGRRFLRFITYVAIGGVTVGVTALLLAQSIVRGFSREIQAKIVGFGAHVQVESYLDAPLQRAGALIDSLSAVEGVVAVAPAVTEFVLLRKSAQEIEGVVLWGTGALPPYLADHLTSGSPSLTDDSGERAGAIVGAALARQLGLTIGQRVTVFSLRLGGLAGGTLGSGQRPRVKQLTVTGIYETALSNFDEIYIFTDIAEARELLQYGADQVSRIDLTLDEVENAPAVAEEIAKTFGFPILARSIYEVFRGLFAWVRLQESIIPLVIGIIIVVAAFNIVATLLMVILEKTREIGVLGSMGASKRALRRLFIWLGLFIGLAGTGLGLLLALTLALIQQRYGLIPLPAEAYYMDTAPIELNPLDFVLVGAVALTLCILSAYVPARLAARIEPVRVIRFR